MLESFSTEEKLNFPLVAFDQDNFSIDGEVEESDCRKVAKEEVGDGQEVASETRSFDQCRTMSRGGSSPKSAKSSEVQNQFP